MSESDAAAAGEPDAWSFEHPETVEMFADQRMTVCVLLEEEKRPPPVMFASKDGLKAWAGGHGLHCVKLKEHDEDRVLHIHGEFRTTENHFRYEHVWVQASYWNYRQAQKDAVDLFYKRVGIDSSCNDNAADDLESEIYSVLPSGLLRIHKVDADHVINKGSLSKYQPEAWVLLFPVPRNANRGFGAKIEKGYPSVLSETLSVDLPPQVAFKFFSGAMPKTKHQFERAMRKVRGIMDPGLEVTKNYVNKMQADLAPHFLE